MLNHSETARKVGAMHKEGLQSLNQISVAEIPASLRSRNTIVRFLMPLAHVVCDANKSRAMVGFLTTDNFAPGKIPEPDTWFKPADFGDDDARQQQADDLEAQDIASVFIRFESGHSNNISIAHTPFRPDVYPLRYLVHGTNEKNLPSIRRLGLIPGGTRGGRNHMHFALDCLLSSMTDALRPESDCILIARPGAVADLNPVITESRYSLTPHTVPFECFCGVWSLIDRAWIDIPPDGELSRMNDYNSDIDISMHIAHHQMYWEKKNENDQDNVTWQRTGYTHYVADQISDPVIAAHFLNSFKQAKAESARPVRDTSTPNDRPLGPPKTSDDERVDRLREEVRKRFENRLKKEKTHDVSSTSESEQAKAMPKQLRPATPIQAKAMPKQRQQKGTARTVSSAAASDSKASASRTAESSARDERGKPVKGSVAKRETSTQAKELFKDADAAKKIFTKFKQETEAIEWYQRPPGPQCCKNFETCNAEDAMFWCHPCGLAYCLDCRVSGLACDHHIVNYSSESSSDFMPDSIGSKDSPFDVGAIIDSVLTESAYFGKARSEQAQTRQENYEGLVYHLKNGQKLGNSYLQSFVKHGIEDYD